MSHIVRHCAFCGESFRARLRQVKLGRGRFCSLACANRSRCLPLVDRFFDSIGPKTEKGCILWVGSKSRQISNGGRLLLAARVAYEIFIGPIPDGLCVCHTCDNGHLPCITPTHFFLGTHADNMADRNAKGRHARGTMIPHAKLTDEKVREIRTRRAAGELIGSIADSFGISHPQASLIIARKKWAHVT